MTEIVSTRIPKIAIVAGEKSGDALGGALMEALKKRYSNISFIGIGGNKMESQGLDSFFKMSEISVM